MNHIRYIKLLSIVSTIFILSACGDSSLQESGGGAGDGSADPEAVALVQPFVGVYDLQDDWNGQAGDQAFLSIRQPDIDGVAEALLLDFDDIDNCVLNPVVGEVSKDPVSTRIFLDNIAELNAAVISLSGTTLTIELEDEIDRDGDGNITELVQISAERIAMMETDLGVSCF